MKVSSSIAQEAQLPMRYSRSEPMVICPPARLSSPTAEEVFVFCRGPSEFDGVSVPRQDTRKKIAAVSERCRSPPLPLLFLPPCHAPE